MPLMWSDVVLIDVEPKSVHATHHACAVITDIGVPLRDHAQHLAVTESTFVRKPDPRRVGRHFLSYLDRDLSNATERPQRAPEVSSRHLGDARDPSGVPLQRHLGFGQSASPRVARCPMRGTELIRTA